MIIAPAPQEKLESPRFSLRSLFIFVAIASLPLAFFGYLYQTETVRRAEIARLDELDEKTRESIVKEIDAICLKLGRAPKDQAELEKHLGKPMPEVHDELYPTPIDYYRTGANSFTLSHFDYSGQADDLVYDSKSPKAGWVPVFD